MKHWAEDAIIYHIYPLGFCDAPQKNDFNSPANHGLSKVQNWLDHIQQLGANAIYLGPVFESSQHGYDTVDYYHVDRRLGNNETLKKLSKAMHERGMRLILDGVFNHVGRDFWAFHDLKQNGENSVYREWFHNLCFGQESPYGDPFGYESWHDHFSLVKLNLQNPAVKEHLFNAVAMWIQEFQIDGLRLDAADCMDLDFLRELGQFCRSIDPEFWLVGEVVHGDYRTWANAETLDSVTNYECYKGLYSSHKDANYFEIAYALYRQFGERGIYRGLPLYAFADNHDVDRVASSLDDPEHLNPLYTLLFTMPGVPSIYYGSEWGIEGLKTEASDEVLRPPIGAIKRNADHQLAELIQRLAQVRTNSPALKYGEYKQLHVDHQQFVFLRTFKDEYAIVVVNAANHPVSLTIDIPEIEGKTVVDTLNKPEHYQITQSKLHINAVPAYSGKILIVTSITKFDH